MTISLVLLGIMGIISFKASVRVFNRVRGKTSFLNTFTEAEELCPFLAS